MKHTIFPTSFFFKYKAPNADELIQKANSYGEELINNEEFTWNNHNASDCIKLKWQDWIKLFQPTLELFSAELKVNFKFHMYDPWLNLYKRGATQEVHDHFPCDFSLIFIVNDGPGFAKFFFMDRNSISLSAKFAELLKYHNRFEPELTTGDVLIFPSNQLHGVFPHGSDEIRRTIAINFDIIL